MIIAIALIGLVCFVEGAILWVDKKKNLFLPIGAILLFWGMVSACCYDPPFSTSNPITIEERECEDGTSFQYIWHGDKTFNITKIFNKTFPKETKFVVKRQLAQWSVGMYFNELEERVFEAEKN